METRFIPAEGLLKFGYSMAQAIRILAPHQLRVELVRILRTAGRITKADVEFLATLHGVRC